MKHSGYDSWPGFPEDSSAPTADQPGRVGTRVWLWLDTYARATVPVLFSLFLASALLNMLVGVFQGYRPNPHALDWDEIEYWSMSDQMLAGHWDFGARRTIAYPLVIAALRLINNDFKFVQVGLSVISALSAPLLYSVVRRLSGSPGLGLLAGILLAVWPAQLFLASSMYSESVALPCFLLFLLALPPGSRSGRSDWPAWRGGAIIAGLALGLCAQIRPMYLLFLPFALVIPFLEERSSRIAARTALLVGLGFAVVVAPWSWWTSSRNGQFIILTANGGETLAGGLNPRLIATPDIEVHLRNRDTWVGPGKWLPPQDTGYLSPAEMALPYTEMSHLLKQRSLAWIATHPGDALRTELCKLAYMWGFYPWPSDDPARLLAGNITILTLLGVTLAAGVRNPRHWLGLARLWTVPLFTTAVALVSWGSWRFRQPADAALLALCVIAVGTRMRLDRVEVDH